MEIRIDVDELRDYMRDYYGTAAFNGFPAAMMDMWDLDRMGDYEVVEKAAESGVDLRRFQVDDD